MTWLDSLTGRVTMYRLVVILLLALTALAAVLSLTGQLFYPVVDYLATGSLAVVVAWVSGRMLGLLFRVTPHSESAIITGLLLMFLFPPSLAPRDLAAVALAAVLASASKYLLAVRGRHVLNPAAAGALLASFTGLGVATWWVASPILSAAAAIAGFVILHRTRRLSMGGLFVGLSTVLITARLVATGTPAGDAVLTALGSYPILFFAAFMLSEPLTMPPRRWQQLVYATVIALLFSIPFSLGPVYSSPELALVLGNVLAFAFGQRRAVTLEYVGRDALTDSSFLFAFRPRRPLRFRAGQYMELTLPHPRADGRGLRRMFTIASAPGEELVRFGIRFAERSSSFKTRMLGLEPGDTVAATSIGGDFVLPSRADQPVLFVAGGIGVTPFLSHLAHLESRGERRNIVVLYQSTRPGEVVSADALAAAGHPVFVVGAEAPSPLPAHWTYLGDGPITPELVKTAVPDVATRVGLVSGPPALVSALRRVLGSAGVRRVRTDHFSGY